MTIFFKAVLTVIVDEITKQIARAKEADKSYLSFTRNTDISDAKCGHLDAFLSKIAKVENDKTDAKSRETIENLILDCLDSFKTVRVNKEGETYPEGTSEHTLKCLASSLPFVYHNLEQLQLVNTHYDNDALSQFRYYVALYHTKKIVEERLSRVITKRLGIGLDFIQSQEKIVQEALSACTGYMSLLEALARNSLSIIEEAATSKYTYEGLRAKTVLYFISTLRTQLNALSDTHYTTTMFFDLNNSILEVCLMTAEGEISKSHPERTARVRSASMESNASHTSTARVVAREYEPDDLGEVLELDAAPDLPQQSPAAEPALERSVSITAKDSAPPENASSPTQSTHFMLTKLGQDAQTPTASVESKKQAAPVPEVLTAEPATLSIKKRKALAAQQAREGATSSTFSA